VVVFDDFQEVRVAMIAAKPSIAQQLAAWAFELNFASLPSHVVEDARWRMVDQVGVNIAGTREPSAAMVARVAESFGGHSQATTLVYGQRLPAPLAGWVNGTVGHGPDYDDMNGLAAVHISSVAVPAALAAAEARGANGQECLLAMVTGAEIALRIATGAPPHQFHHRGLHGTGVAGPFAAAGIAAKLGGLDAGQIANALGMAGSRSSGLMQTLIDGSWVKRLHPGWAVQGGLTCALLAAEGYTGPREVVEGKFGFFNSLLHGDEELFDFDHIVADLGTRWLLPITTYKPWPNGVWNHASMDGAAAIVQRERLPLDDIARIDTFVPPICIPIVCEPREAKLHPTSPYHLKFSLQYSVGMLLVHGRVEVDDFTEAMVADAAVRSVAERVFCHADESMRPDHFPARVEITTTDGRRFVEDVPAQRGDPDNPMQPDDHRRKFRGNVEPTLGAGRTEELLAKLEDSWNASSIGELVVLTVPERPR
jgi:2-methylcitrate dehydratase PrpD